jgi:hypothetical protein
LDFVLKLGLLLQTLLLKWGWVHVFVSQFSITGLDAVELAFIFKSMAFTISIFLPGSGEGF